MGPRSGGHGNGERASDRRADGRGRLTREGLVGATISRVGLDDAVPSVHSATSDSGSESITGRRVRRVQGALVAVAATLALLGALSSPAAAAECPNEARRSEQGEAGLALPECRAYELVSGPGAELAIERDGREGHTNVTLGTPDSYGHAVGVRTSVLGGRVGFTSNTVPAGSTSPGPYFRSSRGQSGWLTENLSPIQSTHNRVTCATANIPIYSSDLSSAVLADGWDFPLGTEPGCGRDDPELVPGEPRGAQ